MDFDVKKTLDGFGKFIENTIVSSTDMTQEAGDKIHKGVKTFDKEFVSKITPDMGKYGDFAKFGAEMVPGVSSYNSIKEGDWTGAAVAAGIDLTAMGVGVITGGAGAVAVKAGGKVVVKEGTKLAIKKGTKELVESGAKKVIKEVAEEGVKKAKKEIAEAGTKKVIKEVLENSIEKTSKETVESTFKNNIDKVRGIKRYDYGNHYKINENGLKTLRENARYVVKDNYHYLTDKLGRIKSVDIKELKLEAGSRNTYAQRMVGGADRLLSDDGGHLIASQFGGSGELDNLVAMSKKLNRAGGKWYNMEQTWVKALREGKKISVNITGKYSGSSERPSEFIVKYVIDGKKYIEKFIN